MAVTSGVFGKAELTAGALTKIFYNSSSNAATTNVIFCNRGSEETLVRLAIIPASTVGVQVQDFVVYNQPVPVGSIFECMGIVMGTQETLFAYSSKPLTSVRAHGFVDDRGPAVSDIGMATYVQSGLTIYAQGLDISSIDKAATPALVKAIVDAYGGGGGGGGGGGFVTRLTTQIASPLNANTDISVPTYTVGVNRLYVYINGLLASGGSDKNVHAYVEMGNLGTSSTTIRFHDTWAKDTEFTFLV